MAFSKRMQEMNSKTKQVLRGEVDVAFTGGQASKQIEVIWSQARFTLRASYTVSLSFKRSQQQ